MRRFALTRRDEWRGRQRLLPGLQRNFGSQWGQRRRSRGYLRGIAGSRVRWRERHRTGCQASLASLRQREICRQPGCVRPGSFCCGGARAKGLDTGVAASACAR